MNTNYFVCTLGQASRYQDSNSKCRTIGEFLEIQAQRIGDLPAVAFPVPASSDDTWTHRTLSFKQVNKGSQRAAENLLNRIGNGLREPQTVALLCQSSLDFLFTWLALIKLGHAVLLIAPQCQPQAIAHLCKTCSASLLLYDENYVELGRETERALQKETEQSRGLDAIGLPSEEGLNLDHFVPKSETQALTSCKVDSSAIAYLHHTSGTSSGLPKPIPLTHHEAIGVLPHLSDGKAAATFTTTPLYHGGIADLFRAWTSDALIWLFPAKHVPITARNIVRCLEVAQKGSQVENYPPVKYFSSVPYVLQMMEADANGANMLTNMEIVGVGGAALPKEVGDRLVSKGINLISRFGSAECGFLMSSHREYAKDKEWQYLRDASPDSLRFELRDGGLSELVITQGWPHMAKTNRSDGSFATADLFAAHDSIPNAWLYHSRADSQLTLITGKKFDPAPLESAIAASPLLDDVLIFGNGRPYPGALLFRSKSYANMTGHDLIQSLAPTIENLNGESQAHARIPRNMLIPMPNNAEALEKSSKGTVMRSSAERKYRHTIERAYSNVEPAIDTHVSDKDIQAHVTASVRSIVMKTEPLTDETDLFSYGVDSVACMQLRHSIRKLIPNLSSELPLSIVEDCGTIQRLSDYILKARHGHDHKKTEDEDESAEMLQLIEEYGTFKQQHKDQFLRNGHLRGDEKNEVVVLTGATGALGAHILNLYRASDRISKIYCLVRGTDEHAARERVGKALEQKGLDDLSSSNIQNDKVIVLQAQLGDTLLGLDEAMCENLAQEVTMIVHVAWTVNFRIRLRSFAKSSIASLKNLIDLALRSKRAMPPRFAYCSSTASVIRYPQDKAIPEQILDDVHSSSPLGYARSKWVAEQICLQAHLHTRMRGRIAVMRVGQLSGDTVHGIWNTKEAWPMMLSSAKLTNHLPDLQNEPLSWLPVDTAAKAFVEAVDHVGLEGEHLQVYHILNEHKYPEWKDLLAWLQKKEDFEIISPADWVQILQQHEKSSDHPALKLLGLWKEAYSTKEEGASKKIPIFDLTKTKKAISIVRDVQPINEDYINRIWKWLDEAVR